MNALCPRLMVATLLGMLVQSVTIGAEPVALVITSLDSRFDQLVPRDARLEKIADGSPGSKDRSGTSKASICSFQTYPPTPSTNGNLVKAPVCS